MIQLKLKRGDTLVWTLYFTNDDDTPIDLTGRSIRMQARANPEDDPIFDLSIGSGITIIDSANGKYEARISSVETSGFFPRNYFVDIEYSSLTGGDLVRSTDTFILTILKDITK